MKGPWQYGLFVPTLEGDKDIWVITPAGVPGGWKDGEYMSVSGICSEEDARKMAAAPTMLTAIENFLVWWRDRYGEDVTEFSPLDVLALRDAALKARGEL